MPYTGQAKLISLIFLLPVAIAMLGFRPFAFLITCEDFEWNSNGFQTSWS